MKNNLKYLLFVILLVLPLTSCVRNNTNFNNQFIFKSEKQRAIKLAKQYYPLEPETITKFICSRSAGSKHDYYSEGDYWWPNPKDINGAYIRRDGFTNPNNFTAHRKALRRMSIIVPVLTVAYIITGERKYLEKILEHLEAWFINPATMMNPNLLYAQAIKGKVTGRGIGIIDTIHLIEVAKSILRLHQLKTIDEVTFNKLEIWFNKYLSWLTTHQYGIDEKEHGNNHSTWWAAQVAMFAKLTGNKTILKSIRNFYKNNLLPNQMSNKGSFPKEVERTKPFNYSIFNLDGMAMICEITSTKDDNLWYYRTDNGKGMKKGIEFLFPYLKDKSTWPYNKDITHWNELPVRSPSLLFSAIHFNNKEYLKTWKGLKAESQNEEIIRNFPIRQPLLWVN